MARKHTPEEIVRKLRQAEQPVHRRRGRRSRLTAIVIEAESLYCAIRAALGIEPPTS